MFEVSNQPPPLENLNLLASDAVLSEALHREHAGWAEAELAELGARLGAAETIAQGFDANRHPPVLRTHDRAGHRIDEVEFHPSWHALMDIAVGAGLHSSPWAKPRPGAHVARAVGTYMLAQTESGVYCPISMTYGSVPTLRRSPAVAADWLPRIFAREYDRRCRPAAEKSSALVGMAMTENQGGSDLRTNISRAEPYASEDGRACFRLTGHKWFMSAPMCDAFLVLAQTSSGPTCFLVPRWTPDGKRNAIHIQRLKDKLGNRSNASSEVEFAGAHAELIGEAGRGIPTIIEMGTYTRLDCAIGSSGLMRQAVAQAIHHAKHRTAFQKRLVDHALMRNVLADLALESEAATVLAMRLARAFDEEGEAAEAFRRVVTPAAKFWICKRAQALTGEAMEVLGRQRLRRGVPLGAPLPRGAGELDLGGLGKRHVPRRAARSRPRAAGDRRAAGRASRGGGRGAAARGVCREASPRDGRDERISGTCLRARSCPGVAGRPSRPPCAGPGRRRLLRLAPRRRLRRIWLAPARHRRGRDHRPRSAGASLNNVNNVRSKCRVEQKAVLGPANLWIRAFYRSRGTAADA